MTAVDVEEGILKVLQRRIQEESLEGKIMPVLLATLNASDLIGKGPFDFIVSNHVLGHVRDSDVRISKIQ